MAESGWFGENRNDIYTGDIDPDSDTLKWMLLGTSAATFVYDPDLEFIDNGGNDVTDPSFCEVVATNYTGGFAGAGRKTASVTPTYDSANNRNKIVFTNPVWTTLGGAVNDTVTHALLIKEGTNDADSELIACFKITNTTTNGTDFTLSMSSDGNIRMPSEAA